VQSPKSDKNTPRFKTKLPNFAFDLIHEDELCIISEYIENTYSHGDIKYGFWLVESAWIIK
jgi:hypothetical protein